MANGKAGRPKVDSLGITFRVTVEMESQLDEVCSVLGCKRGDFLRACITGAYDQLHGDSQVRQLMDDIRSLSDKVNALVGIPIK